MKQFFTLDNELTNINELINEMIEKKFLTKSQAIEMSHKFMDRSDNHSKENLPSKNVVNRIMNYSKSLDALKTKNKTFVVISN